MSFIRLSLLDNEFHPPILPIESFQSGVASEYITMDGQMVLLNQEDGVSIINLSTGLT